jgi:hypothetical protein
MKSNCSYFACTSDMWSSTQMKAFRALTLHFLTDDFCMQSYTLEVKPTQGKHTGNVIRGEMAASFMKWNLDSARLTRMLQDSGSNMVKDCTDWGIPHFPSIGHSLHLVVGPKKEIEKKLNIAEDFAAATNEVQLQEEGEVDEVEDKGYIDDFDESYAQDALVTEICQTVQDMRHLTVFIKNFTKCIEKIDKPQKDLCPPNPVLKVKMDVCTQQNSTLDMLSQLIVLQRPIDEFLLFYNSGAGKRSSRASKLFYLVSRMRSGLYCRAFAFC